MPIIVNSNSNNTAGMSMMAYDDDSSISGAEDGISDGDCEKEQIEEGTVPVLPKNTNSVSQCYEQQSVQNVCMEVSSQEYSHHTRLQELNTEDMNCNNEQRETNNGGTNQEQNSSHGRARLPGRQATTAVRPPIVDYGVPDDAVEFDGEDVFELGVVFVQGSVVDQDVLIQDGRVSPPVFAPGGLATAQTQEMPGASEQSTSHVNVPAESLEPQQLNQSVPVQIANNPHAPRIIIQPFNQITNETVLDDFRGHSESELDAIESRSREERLPVAQMEQVTLITCSPTSCTLNLSHTGQGHQPLTNDDTTADSLETTSLSGQYEMRQTPHTKQNDTVYTSSKMDNEDKVAVSTVSHGRTCCGNIPGVTHFTLSLDPYQEKTNAIQNKRIKMVNISPDSSCDVVYDDQEMIVSAEYDFTNLLTKNQVLLSQRNRTEQDADALLEQVISGQGDRNLGPNSAPDYAGSNAYQSSSCRDVLSDGAGTRTTETLSGDVIIRSHAMTDTASGRTEHTDCGSEAILEEESSLIPTGSDNRRYCDLSREYCDGDLSSHSVAMRVVPGADVQETFDVSSEEISVSAITSSSVSSTERDTQANARDSGEDNHTGHAVLISCKPQRYTSMNTLYRNKHTPTILADIEDVNNDGVDETYDVSRRELTNVAEMLNKNVRKLSAYSHKCLVDDEDNLLNRDVVQIQPRDRSFFLISDTASAACEATSDNATLPSEAASDTHKLPCKAASDIAILPYVTYGHIDKPLRKAASDIARLYCEAGSDTAMLLCEPTRHNSELLHNSVCYTVTLQCETVSDTVQHNAVSGNINLPFDTAGDIDKQSCEAASDAVLSCESASDAVLSCESASDAVLSCESARHLRMPSVVDLFKKDTSKATEITMVADAIYSNCAESVQGVNVKKDNILPDSDLDLKTSIEPTAAHVDISVASVSTDVSVNTSTIPTHTVHTDINIPCSTKNVHSNTNVMSSPKHVQSSIKVISSPRDFQTNTRVVFSPKNSKNNTKVISSPRHVQSNTKVISSPRHVHSNTKEISSPIDIQGNTTVVSSPRDIQGNTKVISSPRNIQSNNKIISLQRNIQNYTEVISSLKDVQSGNTAISSHRDVQSGTKVISPPRGVQSNNKVISTPSDIQSNTKVIYLPRNVQSSTAVTSSLRDVQSSTAVMSSPRDVQNSTKVISLPRDFQSCTAVISSPRDIQSGSAIISSPRDVQSGITVISSPRDFQNNTRVIFSPKIFKNNTKVISSPRHVQSNTKVISSPMHVHSNTKETSSPKDIQGNTKVISSPRDISCNTKVISSPKNIQSNNKVISSPRNVQNYTEVISSLKDVQSGTTVISSPRDVQSNSKVISTPSDIQSNNKVIYLPRDVQSSTAVISSPRDVKSSGAVMSLPRDFQSSTAVMSSPRDVQNSTKLISLPRDFQSSTKVISSQSDIQSGAAIIYSPMDVQSGTTVISSPRDVQSSSTVISPPRDVTNVALFQKEDYKHIVMMSVSKKYCSIGGSLISTPEAESNHKMAHILGEASTINNDHISLKQAEDNHFRISSPPIQHSETNPVTSADGKHFTEFLVFPLKEVETEQSTPSEGLSHEDSLSWRLSPVCFEGMNDENCRKDMCNQNCTTDTCNQNCAIECIQNCRNDTCSQNCRNGMCSQNSRSDGVCDESAIPETRSRCKLNFTDSMCSVASSQVSESYVGDRQVEMAKCENVDNRNCSQSEQVIDNQGVDKDNNKVDDVIVVTRDDVIVATMDDVIVATGKVFFPWEAHNELKIHDQEGDNASASKSHHDMVIGKNLLSTNGESENSQADCNQTGFLNCNDINNCLDLDVNCQLQPNLVATVGLASASLQAIDTACLNSFSITSTNTVCKGNFSIPSTDTACMGNFSIASNDASCLDSSSLPSSGVACTGSFSILSSDKTCPDTFLIPSKDAAYLDKFSLPSCGTACPDRFSIPSSDVSCLGSFSIPPCDAACSTNYWIPSGDTACPGRCSILPSDVICPDNDYISHSGALCPDSYWIPPSDALCLGNYSIHSIDAECPDSYSIKASYACVKLPVPDTEKIICAQMNGNTEEGELNNVCWLSRSPQSGFFKQGTSHVTPSSHVQQVWADNKDVPTHSPVNSTKCTQSPVNSATECTSVISSTKHVHLLENITTECIQQSVNSLIKCVQQSPVNSSIKSVQSPVNNSPEHEQLSVNSSTEQAQSPVNSSTEYVQSLVNNSTKHTQLQVNKSTEHALSLVNNSTEHTQLQVNKSTEHAQSLVNNSTEHTQLPVNYLTVSTKPEVQISEVEICESDASTINIMATHLVRHDRHQSATVDVLTSYSGKMCIGKSYRGNMACSQLEDGYAANDSDHIPCKVIAEAEQMTCSKNLADSYNQEIESMFRGYDYRNARSSNSGTEVQPQDASLDISTAAVQLQDASLDMSTAAGQLQVASLDISTAAGQLQDASLDMSTAAEQQVQIGSTKSTLLTRSAVAAAENNLSQSVRNVKHDLCPTAQVILDATDIWLNKITDMCKSPDFLTGNPSDKQLHDLAVQCKSEILAISQHTPFLDRTPIQSRCSTPGDRDKRVHERGTYSQADNAYQHCDATSYTEGEITQLSSSDVTPMEKKMLIPRPPSYVRRTPFCRLQQRRTSSKGTGHIQQSNTGLGQENGTVTSSPDLQATSRPPLNKPAVEDATIPTSLPNNTTQSRKPVVKIYNTTKNQPVKHAGSGTPNNLLSELVEPVRDIKISTDRPVKVSPFLEARLKNEQREEKPPTSGTSRKEISDNLFHRQPYGYNNYQQKTRSDATDNSLKQKDDQLRLLASSVMSNGCRTPQASAVQSPETVFQEYLGDDAHMNTSLTEQTTPYVRACNQTEKDSKAKVRPSLDHHPRTTGLENVSNMSNNLKTRTIMSKATEPATSIKDEIIRRKGSTTANVSNLSIEPLKVKSSGKTKFYKMLTMQEFDRIQKEKQLCQAFARINSSKPLVNSHMDSKYLEKQGPCVRRRRERTNYNCLVALENIKFLEMLNYKKSTYRRDDQLKDFKKNYEKMLKTSKHSEHWTDVKLMEGVAEKVRHETTRCQIKSTQA